MEKKEFFDQYKDPRWQKKRLEIMERDNFQCFSCGNTEKTLNVHHTVVYRKETKPWEYKNREFITLCEGCHKEITLITNECKTFVMKNCITVDHSMDYHRVLKELNALNSTELQLLREIITQIKNYSICAIDKDKRYEESVKYNLTKNG
jgi:hypothetical protein